jgi:hypothetical protein
VVSIDAVANGDPLKWEQVTDMNVVQFLNVLLFIKDKNKAFG